MLLMGPLWLWSTLCNSYSVCFEVDVREGSSTDPSRSRPNISTPGYGYLKHVKQGDYSLYISDRYSRVLRRAQWFGDATTARLGLAGARGV